MKRKRIMIPIELYEKLERSAKEKGMTINDYADSMVKDPLDEIHKIEMKKG